MKSRSRRLRGMLVIIAGLTALGVGCLSQSRIFASQPSTAGSLFAAPAGWIEGENYSGIRSWKGEDDRRDFISIIEDDSMKEEVPNPSDQKFIDVVKSASAVPNFIAGIKNWNADKLERVKLPDGHKLILTGTYLNHKGELIRFEEWKYFLKDGYGQINYSELAGPKARERVQVAEILKRYHPFGI